MKVLQEVAVVAALGLALGAGLAACSGDAPNSGKGRGIVLGLDAQARTVTLDHGEIPGLMDGMTMTFDVAPEVELGGIEPGATVLFELRETEAGYEVASIRPVAEAAP